MPLTPAPNRHPTVLAIDCEMVGVGKVIGSRIRDGKRVPDYRSALARLSIVDFDGHILLDTFVNPGEPVKDYRTAVSGVRAENLKGAMSLSDAKVLARKFFGNNIVVGHAVHNDFRVLRYHHDPSLVRDTQTCPEVVRKYGHSVGLRALCEREFSVNVQNGEHSSVRDARAAMAIYHLYHQQWERDLRKPRS
ncbi:ribonuclease H-like protein [Clavulina sp. PMI_390]|nr:ribonuclease H-like protein [Clavulina sp. PMI_390]